MEKRTIVDQVETTRNGVIQVRIRKRIVEGDNILRDDFHRTSIPPGADPEKVLEAVNQHLLSMGEAAIPGAEWDRVSRIVAAEHTPQVVAAAEQAERQRKQEIADAVVAALAAQR